MSAGGKSDTSGLEFTYTELGSPHKASWTLHGASGAFAGAEDEVYAVLSNSGLAARVFPSQASAAKPAPLRRLEVGAGGAAALFSGPSWPALPTYARSRAQLIIAQTCPAGIMRPTMAASLLCTVHAAGWDGSHCSGCQSSF